MKRPGVRKRRWLLALLALGGLSVALVAKAGSFLVIDEPRRSDMILVLAGETDRRPVRALELLARGYGRRVVLDVPTNAKLYEFTQIQLAQKYIEGLSQGASISICPIDGLSTRDESKDAEKCMARGGVKSVLIVTSDFHTRRALSVFRREVSGYEYSVAAARNEVGQPVARRGLAEPVKIQFVFDRVEAAAQTAHHLDAHAGAVKGQRRIARHDLTADQGHGLIEILRRRRGGPA